MAAHKKYLKIVWILDSVAFIFPEFKEQEALILRRTIVQNTTQRTASIYSEDTNPSGSYGNNGWFGGSWVLLIAINII